MARQCDFRGLREVLYQDVFLVGLSVIGCLLSVVCYLLSVVCCQLSVVCSWVVCCELSVVSVWYQELLEIKINWDK